MDFLANPIYPPKIHSAQNALPDPRVYWEEILQDEMDRPDICGLELDLERDAFQSHPQ